MSVLQIKTLRLRAVSTSHSFRVMVPVPDKVFIFLGVPHDPFFQRCSVFPSHCVELKHEDTKGWGHNSCVENLSSLSRALGLSPSTEKKKNLINSKHLSQT